MSASPEIDKQLVRLVNQRDAEASRMFIRRFTPVVRWRVGAALSRYERTSERHSREDVLDLIQEVFVALLQRGGRVLQHWDPDRGLSLEGYIGLVAYREASARLKSGRKSGWAEAPTPAVVLNDQVDERTPEAHLSAKQQVDAVLSRVDQALSPRGRQILRSMLEPGTTDSDLCERFELTASALYTFRSRVHGLISAARKRLELEVGSGAASRRSLTTTTSADRA